MNQKPSPDFLRSAIGTALTAFGIYVEFEVLMRAKVLYDTPEAFKSFLILVPEDPAIRTMTIDSQNLIFPMAGMQYLSYGLAISLLVVAGFIGGIFLRRGLEALR